MSYTKDTLYSVFIMVYKLAIVIHKTSYSQIVDSSDEGERGQWPMEQPLTYF